MKAKIIIPNILAILVLGIGLCVYVSVVSRRESEAIASRQLKSMSMLFARSEALRGRERLHDVARFSMTQSVTAAFLELPLVQLPDEDALNYEKRLRQAWFKKALHTVEAVAATLESRGRAPALVFITDRHGVVLARTTTPNACPAGKNVSNAMPVVKRALDGEPGYTVWSVASSPFNGNEGRSDHVCALMNAGLMETAAVPVWGADDQVAGVLVAGWDVSNGVAAEKAGKLGMALAIVQNGGVYSTSFSTDVEREQLSREIKSAPARAQLEKVYAQKMATQPVKLAVDGDTYWALPAPMLDASRQDNLAYLFLVSTSQGAVWQHIRWPMALFMLGAVLCLMVIGVLLGNHFMKPVIEIEEGVLRIINGDTDYRFDVVSDEVGGLSYRINQLVNALTLQDEGDDENEDDADNDEDVVDDNADDDDGDADDGDADDTDDENQQT